VSNHGILHDALALPVAALVALAIAALAAGRAAARRRRTALLGASAPPAARGGDALLALAAAAIGLALVGPHAGHRTERVPATGADVVFLFDVSQSMLAADAPPSRLDRARALAEGVLAGLAAGDRAALAAFAGHGVLLTPLTPDRDALRELLPAVDPLLFTEPGSRFDAGVRAAIRAFRPESRRPRVLVLLSDGEDPERRESSGLEAIAPLGVRVIAVAYGSEDGAPVPVRGGVLQDRQGRPVSSRADPARLAALADATGGALFRADRFGRVDGAAVLAAVRRDAARDADGTVERSVPRSLATALAALALAALLAEVALARRAPRGPDVWAAPGRARVRTAAALALAAAAAMLAAAPPSFAVEDWAEPPSDDREADTPRDRAAFAAAAEARARAGPADAHALLRTGIARAARGDLAGAERAFFGAAARAKEDAVAGDALFDLGVAALERGDLAAARDAFFDAIALVPGDREAQWNLEWTLRRLAARPPQPPPQGGKPEEERKQEAGDPQEGEPGESAEADPDAAPKPGEPAPRQPPSEGQPARENPVSLDPAAAKRLLDAVSDDPGRALQAAARRSERGPERRGGGSPLW
jgi:Ca-activated chloride channel family protein